MGLTYSCCMTAAILELWRKKTNANFYKTCVHIDRSLSLYTACILTFRFVPVLLNLIFFFMTIEGTYKFVGINERHVICFYFKNTKLTTNSTNTMCNISENYVACVVICNGVTIILLLSCINCIKPRAHKLCRYRKGPSKFWAPKCWHEATTILTVHKC